MAAVTWKKLHYIWVTYLLPLNKGFPPGTPETQNSSNPGQVLTPVTSDSRVISRTSTETAEISNAWIKKPNSDHAQMGTRGYKLLTTNKTIPDLWIWFTATISTFYIKMLRSKDCLLTVYSTGGAKKTRWQVWRKLLTCSITGNPKVIIEGDFPCNYH